MSTWFWVMSLQRAVNGGAQTTTVAAECDLPDGFSRRAAFSEILKTATELAGWTGSPTVLFYSLEPATLAAAPGPAPAAGGAS